MSPRQTHLDKNSKKEHGENIDQASHISTFTHTHLCHILDLHL